MRKLASPDLDISKLGKAEIYRVDISSKAKTVVQMRDDSIVETVQLVPLLEGMEAKGKAILERGAALLTACQPT